MASQIKTYFLVPSWELQPAEITLGSVIADLKSPQRPISAPLLPSQIDTELYVQEQKPFSGTAKRSKEWTVGLFSTFIQMVSLGGEVSFKRSSASEIHFECSAMNTKRFTPSHDYVAKVAQDEGVLQHLKMGGFGAKAFIITGIKIAQDTTIKTIEEHSIASTAQVGIDVPSVQLTVGPKGTYGSMKSAEHNTTIPRPIAFAFQVEIFQVRKRGGVKSKEYVHGALLGVEEKGDETLVIERDPGNLEEEAIEDFGMQIQESVDEVSRERCDIVYCE